MFRRPFLGGAGLAAAALATRRGDAQGSAMPLIARTEMAVQVVDFGWRRDAYMFDDAGPAGAVTNEVYTLEGAARHVRFRFQNGLTQGWTIAGASYAPTARAQANPVDAAGRAIPLLPVTFGNGGRDVAFADQPASAGAPPGLVLPPADDGGVIEHDGYVFRGQPKVVFSDWMPISTVARADGGPGALVSLRVWTPSVVFSGIRPKAINGHPPFQGTTARPYRTFFLPLDGAPGDALTATMADPPGERFGNALSCGAQWIGDVPGLTLLSVGDSALMGGGEVQGYLGPVKRAADMMSTPALPVSHVASAIYGCPSGAFIVAGQIALTTNKISAAFIQTLSGNDPVTVDAARQSLARAVALADFCRGVGTLAVLLSPGPPPVDQTPEKEARRQFALSALTDLQARGYVVHFPSPQVSAAGRLREDLRASDQVHLNPVGDDLVATSMIALLRSLKMTQG